MNVRPRGQQRLRVRTKNYVLLYLTTILLEGHGGIVLELGKRAAPSQAINKNNGWLQYVFRSILGPNKTIPVAGVLMLVPKPPTNPCSRLTCSLAVSCQLRCLHSASGRLSRKNQVRRQKPQKVSLFEELFPEETRKKASSSLNIEEQNHDIPRLPLPEVGEGFQEYHDDLDRGRVRSAHMTSQASVEAFRQEKLAVLVLQNASKSLVESDFRRVAPKGKHIARWTGPGELLKGMRRANRLQQSFLLT